jgi:hypothetical protein
MKASCIPAFLLFTACFFCCQSGVAQKKKEKPIDSTLEANSEKWKVKPHKGMFGKAKPEIGPYITIDVEKLDSPVLRKRTKEGSYSEAVVISSEGWDWDFSKYETIEKRKAYRMLVAKEADTTELLFSAYRVSKEKNLTFLGDLMSKNDEGKNQVLAFKLNISGIMATPYDSIPWRFFMEDSFSKKREMPPFEITRISRWYLITGNDSLYTEPIMHQTGSPGDKYFWEWQRGIFVSNSKGNRIAALKFGQVGDLSNPFYTWIRRDLEIAQQHAIASLVALLIGVMSSQL